jgi:predicted ATPase
MSEKCKPIKYGMNILVGNNEVKKSTILEFIHVALTGEYAGRKMMHLSENNQEEVRIP